MRRLITLFVLLAVPLVPARAQIADPRSKLSPHLRMLVSGDPVQTEVARHALVIRAAGPQRPRPTVGAFILFGGSAEALRQAFTPLGAAVHTVVENLATAEIPVAELDAVAALPDVLHIEESRPISKKTDVSVPATGANQLWYGGSGAIAGGGLTSRSAMPPPWEGNTGQNALVAILDSGIDLLHKDFIDQSGKTRIVGLWDQTAGKGTPPPAPAGSDPYPGNECTPDQINALRRTGDFMFTNPSTSAQVGATMSFLIGAGSGQTAGSSFSKGHNSASVAMADFDRDGNVDMITGNLDGTMTWVKNLGGASFSSQNPITVLSPAAEFTNIATADLNHDGLPDVVGVSYTTNQIAVLLGNGNGTFQTPLIIPVGTNPTTVAIADLNGDGNYDLVVGNFGDGTLEVLLGDGTGKFTAAGSPFPVSTNPFDPTRFIGQYPSYIVVGDFNGDGRPDLAVACFGYSSLPPGPDLSILLGIGDGTFGTPVSIDFGRFVMSVAEGDVNGDGILDLVVACYPNSLYVVLGNGDGSFGTPAQFDAGGQVLGVYYGQEILALADLDGDGILDIAALVRSNTTQGSFYDQLAILKGNGDGTFGKAVLSQTDPAANTTYFAIGNFFKPICTEVDLDGHGTNVAGIAAGNGSAGGPGEFQTPFRYMGMAPEAGLIVVKRGGTTTDDVDGIAYIEAKADALGLPVAINMSFGDELGPHDGTQSYDRMINGLAGPGHILVAATGNEAGYGWHADGKVLNGGAQSPDFAMPLNITSLTMTLWYPGVDQFGVTVIEPGGSPCNPSPIYPGTGGTYSNAMCGTVVISAQNTNLFNLDHEVDITFSNGGAQVPPGPWSIVISGAGCSVNPCVSQGAWDLWVECDPEQPCGTFTTKVDPKDTVDSPASAPNVVAVGSYVTKTDWVSRNSTNGATVHSLFHDSLGQLASSSGQGPLRNCTSVVCLQNPLKPDVIAPGEEIMASYAAGTLTSACGYKDGSCLDVDGQHSIYQGTSQATPHVTGAVALLLSQWGVLTPSQVKLDLAAARSDSFTGGVPNSAWGNGKLAIDRAVLVRSVVVPYVVGFTQAIATAAIQSVGLVVGKVTMGSSETIGTGGVILQFPAGGAAEAPGGQVNLIISTGATLQSIQVTPAIPVIPPGQNLRLTATGTFSDGPPQDITEQVTWSTSASDVATVDGLGVVAAAKIGLVTITATLGTVSGSVQVAVAPPGKCDVNGDGLYTMVDVASAIQQALGLAAGKDVNGDGKVDGADVQAALNAVLSLGCAGH